MKNFWNSLTVFILPFILFLISKNMGRVELHDVNVVLKYIDIAGFCVVFTFCLFIYAYLVGQEVRDTKKICFDLAKIICLLTATNSAAYAYITYQWIELIMQAKAGIFIPESKHITFDILYAVTDFSTVINKIVVGQFIFVSLFKRWILPFPFGFRYRPVRPLGKILVGKKYLTEEQLAECLEEQEKEAKENAQ